jgi:hypothetical protein
MRNQIVSGLSDLTIAPVKPVSLLDTLYFWENGEINSGMNTKSITNAYNYHKNNTNVIGFLR